MMHSRFLPVVLLCSTLLCCFLTVLAERKYLCEQLLGGKDEQNLQMLSLDSDSLSVIHTEYLYKIPLSSINKQNITSLENVTSSEKWWSSVEYKLTGNWAPYNADGRLVRLNVFHFEGVRYRHYIFHDDQSVAFGSNTSEEVPLDAFLAYPHQYQLYTTIDGTQGEGYFILEKEGQIIFRSIQVLTENFSNNNTEEPGGKFYYHVRHLTYTKRGKKRNTLALFLPPGMSYVNNSWLDQKFDSFGMLLSRPTHGFIHKNMLHIWDLKEGKVYVCLYIKLDPNQQANHVKSELLYLPMDAYFVCEGRHTCSVQNQFIATSILGGLVLVLVVLIVLVSPHNSEVKDAELVGSFTDFTSHNYTRNTTLDIDSSPISRRSSE